MTRTTLMLWSAAAAACIAANSPVFAQGQDYSTVEVKTTKLADNFYTLEGAGGTVGILTGPDGVFMVDTQFAPMTDKLVAAIKQVSDKPVRFVVNTHVHGDHTGGDENFAKLGAVVMSRDQLRARLATGPSPASPMGLPMMTYDGPVTFHMNGEDVQLIPLRPAHTDGDTMVRFVKADVIMTGDFYRQVGYPNPDRANGGSTQGLIDALQQLADAAGPNTKLVPGHGTIVNKTDVLAHRQIAIAIRDKVTALVKQGKSYDEIMASKPTAEFDAKVPDSERTIERFVRAIVGDATAARD